MGQCYRQVVSHQGREAALLVYYCGMCVVCIIMYHSFLFPQYTTITLLAADRQ